MTKKAEAGTDSTYSQQSSDWPEGRSTGKNMEIFEGSVFYFQNETGFANRHQLKQRFSLRNNFKWQRRCTRLPSCIGDLEWT